MKIGKNGDWEKSKLEKLVIMKNVICRKGIWEKRNQINWKS